MAFFGVNFILKMAINFTIFFFFLLPLSGFGEAVTYLNSMPQDVVAEVCQEVLAFLSYKKGSLEVAPFVAVS